MTPNECQTTTEDKAAKCLNCGWRGGVAACPVVQNPAGFHPPVAEMRVCPKCMEPTLQEITP